MSFIVSLIVGISISPIGMLLAMLSLLPMIVLMIGFGLLFGTLFSEKAAPGLCSIIISLASFLGGVWFDAEAAGGILFDICKVLPFWHAVKAARMACAMDFGGDFLTHLLITLAYAVVFIIIAIIVFKQKMKADNQ